MKTSSSRLLATCIRIGLALILGISGQALAVSPVSAKSTVTILDTLGAATTSTKFQLAGSGGFPVYGFQHLGPKFVITQTTVITEIGAFLTYCELNAGQTICPNLHPISVEIRPEVNGLPDLSRVLGTFAFPKDRSPKLQTYQAVQMHLKLKPGTYFAIFTAKGDNGAGLLSNATDPFAYQAAAATVAFIFGDQRTGTGELGLAVRILGRQKGSHDDRDDWSDKDD